MTSLHFVSFLCAMTLFSLRAQAQGVAINDSGADPHASAMLDVISTSKGVLIPRMTTVQRQGIANPATGLLVYDASTRTFWFKGVSAWVELTDNFHGLRDADHDTKVQVEESPDEDIIRFDIGGKEAMVLTESTQGHTRLEVGPEIGLMIGQFAGATSFAGWNTFLGYEAGRFNTTGEGNVFVGYRAGQNNGKEQDRNVLIGFETGRINNAWSNTMIGYQSGHNNTTGHTNSFLGYLSGVKNRSGYRNTFLGGQSGHNVETGFENTFVGFNAGYSTENGDLNTFVGVAAGMANRTGLYNTIIGAGAAGNTLNNRDLGNGNAIVGYEAGYFADSIGQNALFGYRAGYNLTTGHSNVFAGYQAGMLTQTGQSNVAIGIEALRQNSSGHRNVAVGDSALMSTIVGGNVAVGSKAGMDNTNGSGNTFIGQLAGENNTSGDLNVMMGWRTGSFNQYGEYNVFIGAEAASANLAGIHNTFVGYAAGFRNSRGHNNIFVGSTAGDNNLEGDNNIGIGTKAASMNTSGNFNIGIGHEALAYLPNGGLTINSNIAIGMQAAFQASGHSNIVIGNSAAGSISGTNNVVIGNDSGDLIAGGTSNVMLGNNIGGGGTNNTLLGAGTSTTWPFVPEGATAVGYGTQVSQDYSVVLGDPSNLQTKVGVGTASPDVWLHIEGQGFEAFRVSQNGTNALRVLTNGNTVVHQELLVNTTSGKAGFEMSVDGSIACEEVLVEASEDWPDYVFAHDYPLMGMDELRTHLSAAQHLPGMPSAQEVASEGVRVGDMQKRLLEKIEELTLYILELESRIDILENR